MQFSIIAGLLSAASFVAAHPNGGEIFARQAAVCTTRTFLTTSTFTVTSTVSKTTTTTSCSTSSSSSSSSSSSTTSSVASPVPSSGPFQLVVQGGRKLVVNSDNTLAPSAGGASNFFLTAGGNLASGNVVFGVQNPSGENLIVGSTGGLAGFAPLVCTVSNPPSRGALQCTVGNGQVWYHIRQNSDNKLQIGSQRDVSPYAQTDLQAV